MFTRFRRANKMTKNKQTQINITERNDFAIQNHANDWTPIKKKHETSGLRKAAMICTRQRKCKKHLDLQPDAVIMEHAPSTPKHMQCPDGHLLIEMEVHSADGTALTCASCGEVITEMSEGDGEVVFWTCEAHCQHHVRII